MKRLLIAMSAVAMMSLCAKADAEPTLLGGMNFENYDAGSGISIATDPQDTTGGLIFWAGSNGESYVAEEETATAGVSNKFLKVETTDDVLVRQTADNASEVKAVDIGGGDITVSAKVQFTAADEAPKASAGDKLIVWAKAPDEDDPESTTTKSTTTNLMVTAKTAGGVVTNFVTDVLVDAETWYDLEIKAEATGSQNDGDASTMFTVSIARSGETPVAVTVGGQAATFKSLLAPNDPAAQKIASVGFKGTGAVDDIVFAKNVAVDVTVTVTCTAGYDVYLDQECGDEYVNPLSVKAGRNAVVYVYDKTGTCVVSCEGGSVGTWDSENKVWPVSYPTDAQHLEVTMAITVEPGDGKTAITANDVTLSYEQATYYEGITFPTVTVTVNKMTLTENTDYTVNWVPAEITAKGGTFTVTVAGNGNYKGSVVKTVTVTPAGGETAKVGDTEYTTGADFVAAATSGTVNTLPSTWTVEGNTVKDGTGAPFATFPEFYTVSLTGTTLTLELNNKALETVGTMTAVTVGTNFGLSVSASDAKLYYGLASCATVNGTYAVPTTLATLTKGTGGALTLSAAKSEGSACFYKLYVTDIAPQN